MLAQKPGDNDKPPLSPWQTAGASFAATAADATHGIAIAINERNA
jgi:hypothetical protein